MYVCISYTYKFLRDVIFVDYPWQICDFCDFIFVDLLLSHLELQVYYNCFIKFGGFNFVDDKLPTKTAKFMSLKNFTYTVASSYTRKLNTLFTFFISYKYS